MTRGRLFRQSILLAGAALALAACATASKPQVAAAPAAPAPPPVVAVAPPPPPPPPVKVPVRDRINRALELLGRGEPQPARTELALVLAEQPTNATAKRLLQQIDTDPKVLLGQKSYAYKVRPGETLSELADRFLGDPLLFYALARYNGIYRPDEAEVGRTLLIPGAPKKVAPQVAARPATPGADSARAVGLRRTALEAMNKGSIDQAVALLQQAAPLDPENKLIRTDLERALRIQQSVRRR